MVPANALRSKATAFMMVGMMPLSLPLSLLYVALCFARYFCTFPCLRRRNRAGRRCLHFQRHTHALHTHASDVKLHLRCGFHVARANVRLSICCCVCFLMRCVCRLHQGPSMTVATRRAHYVAGKKTVALVAMSSWRRGCAAVGFVLTAAVVALNLFPNVHWRFGPLDVVLAHSFSSFLLSFLFPLLVFCTFPLDSTRLSHLISLAFSLPFCCCLNYRASQWRAWSWRLEPTCHHSSESLTSWSQIHLTTWVRGIA